MKATSLRLFLLGTLALPALRADISWDAPATAYHNVSYFVGAEEPGSSGYFYIDKGNYFFADGWGSAGDWTSDPAPDVVPYDAYSEYGSSDTDVTIVHPNHAPENVTIDRSAATINLGSTVTISSTAEDEDGNMSWHDLLVQPPGGGSYVARSTSGTGWSSNSNTPPNPSNASNSSISGVFTPSTTGTWAFKANAYDGEYDGNQPTTSVSVVDGTSPSTPTGLYASSNTTGTSFTLNWSASSDNIGVTGYEVQRDSETPVSESGTSKGFSGLAQNITYGMKVRARDAAGNWSGWSSTLNVTTPDVTAPGVPTLISGGSISTSSFVLSWTAPSDNVGVTGYEVQLNSTTPVSAIATSKSFSGLSSGTTYAMKVRAKDAANNWSNWSDPENVTTATSLDDSDSDGLPNGIEDAFNTGELDPNTDASNTNSLNVHLPLP